MPGEHCPFCGSVERVEHRQAVHCGTCWARLATIEPEPDDEPLASPAPPRAPTETRND